MNHRERWASAFGHDSHYIRSRIASLGEVTRESTGSPLAQQFE